MNVKGNKTKKQAKVNEAENNVINMLSEKEMIHRAETIKEKLTSWTWRDLETHGKFDKNKKLSFITDDMLIVGCDIGSDTHYVRAIDTRGRELSKEAYSFSNTREGFESAREWALKLAAKHKKQQIVLGLEPTGHYWFVRPYRVILKCRDTRLSHCSGIFLSAGACGVIRRCRAG